MELLEKMMREFVGKFVFWKGPDETYSTLCFGKIVDVAFPYMKVERPKDFSRHAYYLAIKNDVGVDTILVNLLTLGLTSLEMRDPIQDAEELDAFRKGRFEGCDFDFDFIIEVPR
ncbi:MAG: hypothetical protein G01um101429_810 [Parcubacteria group bacterium Gr01-1014_29]|nr:MAG: hypothetical protein G01um101429_810 [Parcubacteria group bacterium Gr01-1014_29]